MLRFACLGMVYLLLLSTSKPLREKTHDSSFPRHAIRWALELEGISFSDIKAVAFYDKPLVKFERILKSHVANFPQSFIQFWKGMPSWFSTKLRLSKILRKEFDYKGAICYGEHHRSHAASTFYASGFEKAAVLTVDGVGEWSTTTWGIGEGTDLNLKGEIIFLTLWGFSILLLHTIWALR